MTRIDEPPERPEHEIVLTGDLASRPPGEIVDTDLLGCDELTDPDEFPEHGEFLRVETPEGTEFWEVAGGLREAVAEKVAENGTEPEGAVLAVRTVAKTPGGAWRFQIELRSS